MLPFVYINGVPFSMYAVMAMFGIVFAVTIALLKHKAFSLRKRDVLLLAALATIGAFFGAKLFGAIGHIIKHGGDPGFWTLEHWSYVLSGGGVFYGGLLGAIGLAALWAKIGRLELKNVLGIGAYVGFAFQSMGRLGCYCAGCCHGIELAFPEAEFFVVPVEVYGITKENWYTHEYGVDWGLGELSRCGNQFPAEIKKHLSV